MSFIQCKNEDEVEQLLRNRKHAFTTEDFRIYESVTLSDDALYYNFDSELAMALLDLKLNVEMIGKDGFEMAFTQLVRSAKIAEDSYAKISTILKRRSESRI